MNILCWEFRKYRIRKILLLLLLLLFLDISFLSALGFVSCYIIFPLSFLLSCEKACWEVRCLFIRQGSRAWLKYVVFSHREGNAFLTLLMTWVRALFPQPSVLTSTVKSQQTEPWKPLTLTAALKKHFTTPHNNLFYCRQFCHDSI